MKTPSSILATTVEGWSSGRDEGSLRPATLSFLEAMWHLAQGLKRASEALCDAAGVDGQERFIMRVIRTVPGLTLEQLSATLHLDRRHVRKIVQGLVRRRLLLGIRQPSHGRTERLYLTAAGKRIGRTDLPGSIEAVVSRVLEHYTGEERQSALRMLQDLAKYLNAAKSGRRGVRVPARQDPHGKGSNRGPRRRE